MIRTVVELVGLLSVIISLVFVGLELRQNTAAVRTANHYALLELGASMTSMVISDPEMSRIAMHLADGTEDELNEVDYFRAISLREQAFNMWEAAHYNYRSEQLDPEIWSAWDAYFRDLITPSARPWWKARRHIYSESFRSYVDPMFDGG